VTSAANAPAATLPAATQSKTSSSLPSWSNNLFKKFVNTRTPAPVETAETVIPYRDLIVSPANPTKPAAPPAAPPLPKAAPAQPVTTPISAELVVRVY